MLWHWLSLRLCAWRFIVESQSIGAHKAVLYARCERFRLMFQSGMKEVTVADCFSLVLVTAWWQAECDTIPLEGLNYSTALALFTFIYTGEVIASGCSWAPHAAQAYLWSGGHPASDSCGPAVVCG